MKTLQLSDREQQVLKDLLASELAYADEDFTAVSKLASQVADEKILLFAYGTLKRGHFNHYRLGINAHHVANDTVLGDLRIPNPKSPYPFLLEGSDNIRGEIWEVDEVHYTAIRNMEVSAGYVEKRVRTNNNRLVNVFYAIPTAEKSHYLKIDEFKFPIDKYDIR